MPIYVYQVIEADGSDGEIFEVLQRMSDAPLSAHPENGKPVKKLLAAPTSVSPQSGLTANGLALPINGDLAVEQNDADLRGNESTELLRPAGWTQAADSFRQGWKEAMSGETLPIDRLWEGIDVE